MKRRTTGFTLIELLIVVAIIAILAAIAVPNFLEAQVRAKVSRAKADMRTLVTAVEAYVVDHNVYPYCNGSGISGSTFEIDGNTNTYLEGLSTPVAYITSAFLGDPFATENRMSIPNCAAANIIGRTPTTLTGLFNTTGLQFKSFFYQSWNGGQRTFLDSNGVGVHSSRANAATTAAWGVNPNAYAFQSGGPDRVVLNSGGIIADCQVEEHPQFGSAFNVVYDPTNGTVSFGSIWRVGGAASGAAKSSTGFLQTPSGRAYGDGFTTVMYRAQSR